MTIPSLRRLGLVAAIVAASVMTLGLGSAAILHSAPGERLAARVVEDALSAPGTAVVFDDLAIEWPFRLSARAIRVADPKGVWLRIERPEMAWRPLRLLRRVVAVDRLEIGRIVVERPPEATGTPPPSGPGRRLPRLRLALESVAAPIVLKPPVVGEEVHMTLRGAAHTTAGGGAVDLRLRAKEGSGLRVAGIAGPDFVDLRWYLDIPRIEPWARLVGADLTGRLGASGSVAGRFPNPAITGSLDLRRGSVEGVAWDELALSFYAVPGGGTWSVSSDLSVTRPALAGGRPIVPTALLQAVFSVTPAERLVRLGDVQLVAPGINAGLSGILAEWGRHADLRADLHADDLSRVRPGLPVTGRGQASAIVRGDLLALNLRAVVRVSARHFATGTPRLDRLLGPSPSARAEIAVDGGVRLLWAAVDGAQADAVARGRLTPGIALVTRLRLRDLKALSERLSGAAVVRSRVHGSLGRLDTWGVARIDGAAAGTPVDGMLGFDVIDLTHTPAGTLTADLMAAGHPVAGRARVALAAPVRIEDIAVSVDDSRVSGAVAIAGAGPQGRLAISVPRLSVWRPDLAGAVEGTVVFDGPRARLSAHGRGLTVAGLTLHRAVINAAVADLADPRIRFRADGQGPMGRVEAAGEAVVQDGRGMVALDRLGLDGLRLAQTTRVLWGPDGVALEPAVLGVGQGRVRAEGRLVRGRLDGRAGFEAVPLEALRWLVPNLDPAGVVDGMVVAAGTAGDPIVTLRLTGRNLATASTAGLGGVAATLDATWAGGVLDGTATARAGDRLRLEASGRVPLSADAPVEGRVTLDGDLGRLAELATLSGQTVSGRLKGELRITGSRAAPNVDGRIAVAGGRYENFETGTIVDALRAEAAIRGRRAEVIARATDARAGTATLDAVVDADGDRPNWRGKLALRQFRAVRNDDIRATVTADLDLSGAGTDGRIAGRAAIDRAEVDLGRLGGNGPPALDVIELNRPGGTLVPASPQSAPLARPGTVALAIDLAIARTFVRGRGLDSEWNGNLQVAGTLAEPVLTGNVSPERGRYELLGRTFRLSPDSTVVFQGTPGIDPRLAVTAEARAGDIIARAEVTGTARDPQMNFTSQPPLPRDEVLSRVLFGTEAGKLTAFQQIQLGQLAARGLTGGGEGFDPIGGVRGLLGLDVLEVGAGENGKDGPTVSAGKYIGEDTFLRLEQGTQGSGRVTVEQQLGGGFAVTTELGDQSGGGVGLEWRKDY